MTTDLKDLLTRAAKGAGYKIERFNPPDGILVWLGKNPEVLTLWQPHLDDGDCLRLADAMEFMLALDSGEIWSGTELVATFTPHNREELRMAVLRAAAE